MKLRQKSTRGWLPLESIGLNWLTVRLCDNVNMKAHVQAIRHLVYQVFDSLLALHRQTFKAMGSDFLNSFTKMVDGEKDPRNLMLLFSLEKVILLEFDIKDHVEVSISRSTEVQLLTRRTCSTSPSAIFPFRSVHRPTTPMESLQMT